MIKDLIKILNNKTLNFELKFKIIIMLKKKCHKLIPLISLVLSLYVVFKSKESEQKMNQRISHCLKSIKPLVSE